MRAKCYLCGRQLDGNSRFCKPCAKLLPDPGYLTELLDQESSRLCVVVEQILFGMGVLLEKIESLEERTFPLG
jgi:hypothetical protein